jgi:hypothetical protein
MLQCCAADAKGSIPDGFYNVCDELGFSRTRPHESWRCALRLLVEILSRRNTPSASKFNNLTPLQISQQINEKFDLVNDEEVARFLLSYAIGMRNFIEGQNMRVVLLPAKCFEISKRSVANYWVSNLGPKEDADEGDIDLKVV